MIPTRYWAPSGPGVGPDGFDLQLLSPGIDAELDLGAALLALHRVGAAACLTASETPLLDEHAFLQTLASARARVADPAVDSISKAVSGGVGYAGLLVRDVLDSAEKGALAVYRGAVAKGVVPPVAAIRAGAVYGCPPEELGRYRALASDPRAHQAALTDLADRALFRTVSKIAGQEAAEPVVKAAAVLERPKTMAVTRDDPATAYYDARDAGGRFASVGTKTAQLSMLAALKQKLGIAAKAPEVATAPPEVKRQTHQVRQVRQRRQVRAEPQVGVKQTTAKPTALKGKIITALHMKPTPLQARLAKPAPRPSGGGGDNIPEYNPMSGDPYIPADVLAMPVPDDFGAYARLEDGEFSYVLPERHAKQWLAAMERATNSAGVRMIRLGWLMDEYGNPSDSLDPSFEDVIDQVVRNVESDTQIEVRHVPLDELEREGGPTDYDKQAYLDRLQVEMATDEMGVFSEEAHGGIDQVPDYGGGMQLVRLPVNSPTVYHFRFTEPRGGRRGRTAWFDPNAPYKAEYKKFDEEQFHRDPTTKEVVRHVIVTFAPASEDQVAAFRKGRGDIGKAVTTLERAQIRERVRHQPRNEHGEWVDTGMAIGARPQTEVLAELRTQFLTPLARVEPKRQVRQVRQTRQRRQTGFQAQAMGSPVKARISLQQQLAGAEIRARIAQAETTHGTKIEPRPTPDAKNAFQLDPNSVYRVFDMKEWIELQNAQGIKLAGQMPSELLIGNAPKFFAHDYTMGDETNWSIRSNYIASQDARDQRGKSKRVYDEDDDSPGGRYALLEYVRNLANKPGIANVSAERSATNSHPGRWRWTIYTNIQPPEPVIVVEIDPDAETAAHTNLKLVGPSTYQLTVIDSDDLIDIYAIPMLHYRASRWYPGED